MVLSNQYAQIYQKSWWKILDIVKHRLVDSDYVYTEESASAEKTGFENKNLRVSKELLLPELYMTEAQSCAMGKIFPRAVAFCLSSFAFFLYFYTQLILTPCSIIFFPIHSDARSLR